jgi:hypothetical protein
MINSDILVGLFQQQADLLLEQIQTLKKLSKGNSSSSSSSSLDDADHAAPTKGGKKKSKDAAAGDAGGKQKKDKANKHPQPLSAYQIFMKDEFHNFKEENPTINAKDAFGLLAKHWKDLDPEVKQHYVDKSDKLKQEDKDKLAASSDATPAAGSASTGKNSSSSSSSSKTASATVTVPAKNSATSVTVAVASPVFNKKSRVPAVTASQPEPEVPFTQSSQNDDIFGDEVAVKTEKKHKKKKKHHHDEGDNGDKKVGSPFFLDVFS